MTKAIKFNLILDGRPVRNLDELKDSFNIEELITSYRNGLLVRWLDTRGLYNEIAELEEIPEDDMEAAKLLCTVFHMDLSNNQVEKAVFPFFFRKKERELLDRYNELKDKRNEVVRAYHEDYRNLLLSIEHQSKSYSFVKSAVEMIFNNYFELYLLDAVAFYERFITDHPLVILALLANTDMRPHIAKELIQVKKDIESNVLIPHVESFSGITEGYWKDLKPKGTKYLIIHMVTGNFVRSCGLSGEELKSSDVNGKFPILDGVDYKSNNSSHKLLYMEI